MELKRPPREVVRTHPAMDDGVQGEETGEEFLEEENSDEEEEREEHARLEIGRDRSCEQGLWLTPT